MHKRYQQEQLMAEIHARTLAANGDYGKVTIHKILINSLQLKIYNP